jgi:hypothetical protein
MWELKIMGRKGIFDKTTTESRLADLKVVGLDRLEEIRVEGDSAVYSVPYRVDQTAIVLLTFQLQWAAMVFATEVSPTPEEPPQETMNEWKEQVIMDPAPPSSCSGPTKTAKTSTPPAEKSSESGFFASARSFLSKLWS